MKNDGILLGLLAIVGIIMTKKTVMTLKEFVAKLRPIAEEAAKTNYWPVPAASDMIITQAVHESGAQRKEGASTLALLHNNLFGITAELGTFWRTKNYPFVEMPTTEYDKNNKPYKTVRPFRKYDTWAASVADYTRMIKSMPIYAGAVNGLRNGDFQAFAAGLQKAGYATDQTYQIKLSSLYRAVKETTV